MLEGTADPLFVTARASTPTDALARLAAGVAHELNNPLSVMVGYLSLISSGQTHPDKLSDQLQRIEKEARQCRVVLQGLTELAESTLADPERLDLRTLLVDAQTALGERPPLAVHIEDGSAAPLIGQARGLATLLSHVIRNAVEASARTLRMQLTRGDGVTRLELQDDGEGMSESLLARAREAFFSTKLSHLGLGLAVCDAVAWAHGGSLTLASREGQGTTLTLSLPSGGAVG